jgi:hypothetical protein
LRAALGCGGKERYQKGERYESKSFHHLEYELLESCEHAIDT